jgi:hypothetical protein
MTEDATIGTSFLYPFIEAQERGADRLLADLASSARRKAEQSRAVLARPTDDEAVVTALGNDVGHDRGEPAVGDDVDDSFTIDSQSIHRIQESQALVGHRLWLVAQRTLTDPRSEAPTP